MKIKIIAVGTKMPGWVQQGYEEYARRLPAEFSLELIEIPLGQRGKNADIARAIKREGDAMLAALDKTDHIVALEVNGKSWSTEKLALEADKWQMMGCNVALLIGGPDGLAESCRQRARQQWSLSALTLPHPLVRVLLAEQLYRAWSINQNHPYHR